MDLHDFLEQRIAEDEAAARVATDSPWWYDPTKWNSIDHEESVFAGTRGLRATTVASTGPGNDPQSMADAAHIARHDPARVLAECAAKRAIVAEVERMQAGSIALGGEPYMLRILAAVYSDHPEFREEWRP